MMSQGHAGQVLVAEQLGTHWEAISNGICDGFLDFLEAVAPAGLHKCCDSSLGYSS